MWVLRADLRRIDRRYGLSITQAKGDKREYLIDQYMEERAGVEEEIEGAQTQRLLRRAWRYYIVAPEKPSSRENQEDDT